MSIITAFNRLVINTASKPSYLAKNVSTSANLLFRATPCLMAEPLKKKKRIDPAVLKQREDRKKKKIEKQIRRLEKNARQLKPIEECEVPITIIEQEKLRRRPLVKLSAEVLEDRVLLMKNWARYKHQQSLQYAKNLDSIMYSQQKALDELRKESEELYQEAIQIDFMLLPYKSQGPTDTPPIEKYDAPDGDYQDVSRKWKN